MIKSSHLPPPIRQICGRYMSKTISQQLCYHCGDVISIHDVVFNNHHFCCDGCKTVHQVLTQSGMQDYYRFAQNPGNKVKVSDNEAFAYLDNAEISTLLVDFKNDNLVKLSLSIPGIHCSSCIWLLENLHLLDKGILNSRVDFLKKEFSASINPDLITIRQLAELLDSLGYTPQITLENNHRKKADKTNKTLLLKLAVAGFCFGNIMLFSFPEYFGFTLNEDKVFAGFFSMLNLILGLPVLFYSASDYFVSAWKSISKGVLHINVPLALGMAALFLRSVYEIVTAGGPGYMDSFAGLLFFLLAGKWFQNYTYDHLNFERDYTSYFPLSVTWLNHSRWETKLLSTVKKGDRLRVKNGELIAADAIILSGEGYIDYSFVTGESEPVHKVLGEVVYGGGKQTGSTIEIEVMRNVSQSQLTKIWNSNNQETEHSRLQSFSDKVSRYFTIALLIIATATLVYWSFTDISKGFFAFTSVLIVACPCALALSSPLALGNALRLLGRGGLYLKNAQVVEELARINHIVFDKTGTLTSSEGFEVIWHGEPLSPVALSAIKGIAVHSAHPYSRAISRFIEEPALPVSQFTEKTGAGVYAHVKNIGEIKLGNARFCEAGNAHQGVFVNLNGEIPGWFEIRNKYRKGVKPLLTRLAEKYKLSVLSGDDKARTAELTRVFNGFENIYFNQTPQQKKTAVEQLENSGDYVLMVGDGLNDAGALLSSNAGIVVTENTAQFTPAAKGILLASSLGRLNRMLLLANKTLGTIKTSFGISVVYNLVGICFAVQGLLSPVVAAVLMPLSSITVVLFNTITTNYWAKKLKLK